MDVKLKQKETEWKRWINMATKIIASIENKFSDSDPFTILDRCDIMSYSGSSIPLGFL